MNRAFFLNQRQGLGLTAAMLVSAVAAIPAAAGTDTEDLDECLKQVHKIKNTSAFVKLEYLSVSHDGDPSFEIEVRDDKGLEWEFMCEAGDGDIYEVEQEVTSASDPKFKSQAKVSEQQAIKTVTNLYPGEVQEVEYEIESNGEPTYEIDVVDDHDTEWKVEVDAASGDIIEVQVEKWEIGEEADESAGGGQ